MKKSWVIGLKSGVITFLGLIAYGLLLPSLGLSGLEYVVLALGIYSGHYYYKAANNGLMTYPQGLKLGLITVSFTGLLNGLIIYLYTQHTSPVWSETLMKSMQQKGVDESVIEEIGQLIKQLPPALLGIGIFISTVLLGFVLTLLITLFSRAPKRDTSP